MDDLQSSEEVRDIPSGSGVDACFGGDRIDWQFFAKFLDGICAIWCDKHCERGMQGTRYAYGFSVSYQTNVLDLG